MDARLKFLAEKLGVSVYFSDAGVSQKNYEVDEKTVRFFCAELGYLARNAQEVESSLKAVENKSWKTPFENMIVMRQDKPEIIFSLPATYEPKDLSLELYAKGCKEPLSYAFFCAPTTEEKIIGSKVFRRWQFVWQDELPWGYYDFILHAGKEVFRTILACVPSRCYTTDEVENGRLWGFNLQLYSLKSCRNWGVGDLTDLKNFAHLCARVGADVIGLNPLNPLFHDFPENASPYNSVSRMFLNPIYLDVEKVPTFSFDILPDLKAQIADAKKGEYINYTKVYQLKMKVLHQIFEANKFDETYQRAFQKFMEEEGWHLEIFATYQALYSKECTCVWGGCAAWPKELQNPASLAVGKFRKDNAHEILFFKFLQFETSRQFQEVFDVVKHLGLKIGLYRDLPVGVCKDSAEFWCDKGAFMPHAGAGAPPDAFFPNGQKWCLGAFQPFALKQRAYEPFLKVLRANMRCAGALRIDHVMGLMRLFMIPDREKDGTYISYAFDDMLGLVALESHLNKTLIVGESIGNVPEGFMDHLQMSRIYSISVLWSERWQNGSGLFKMPCDYCESAFVSVGTHDMPPLKMWWFGYDIELRHRLKMINDSERIGAYKLREADRQKLLDALDYNRVWPEDKPRKGNYLYGEGYPEGLEEAVHRLIAASCAKVALIQPEDVFQVSKQQNVPGTDCDVYPNWRLRLPIDLEDFLSSEAFMRNVNAMKRERGR